MIITDSQTVNSTLLAIVSIWLMLFLCPVLKAQTKQVITYYDKGKEHVKEKYTISNTKPPYLQGPYENYYANGKVRSRGTYKKGVPDGNWTYYYENGKLKIKGNWQNSRKNGIWSYYYENGNLQMEGTLQNEIRTNQWSYYYESGALKNRGTYINDQKEGLWEYFYEDGKKKAEATLNNDNGWYREFYASGNIRMQGLLTNGKSDSLWSYYYENGKLKAKGPEKEGVREGLWHFYDENEKLIQEGEYKDGIQEGKWKYYHPNGAIAAEGKKSGGKEEGIWNLFYANGTTRGALNHTQQDGNYIEYHENGKLKAKGSIRNGLYEGEWQYFYEDDGTLEGHCVFVDGKGLYKGIYKDGKPRMEGHLENDKRVGLWTLYKPDGGVAGYYEAFYENEIPVASINPTDSVIITDTITRVNQPYNKPSLRLPKKHNWHFISKPNEYRAFIVGINPLAMFWQSNPSLPLSFEYYMHERLGYEFTATIYRNPFFTSNDNIADNVEYSRGFSIGIKQKFYQPDGNLGMLYIAHEIRFSGINHQANVQDINSSYLVIQADENRYEYSFMVGDRFLQDPSRTNKKNKGNRFTLDGFAGLGIAYRHYNPQWSNKPEWDTIFKNVPKSKLLLTLRLGIMLGYAF
ncbi:toxin-antitoxin system YwqK family antitoxin [Cytophagaceae bacterium YF14B1]|uniref:Toxin-antitoxin system YwqK family antitoxin n=1 Tax=Xanthocytophaga flava TaxID=3048013 RepID=A0AAE3QWG4_9BACT|nr:toxin-antitoxin system YwqK family antitoxin [Xanthocytophaga flavus]MDJ1484495.1 toxin-antitoxin system YwqK family antitoxin [Xanthocytophaga flavus]